MDNVNEKLPKTKLKSALGRSSRNSENVQFKNVYLVL